MNLNIDDNSEPVCLIDLDNLELPVSIDPPMFGNLRIDDEHGGSHAFVDSVDHQFQSCKGDFSQDLDLSAELKYINHVLLEDDAEENSFMYGAPNSVPYKLNFDPQVHTSRNDCPEYVDHNDDVLTYIRHILLDENAEEKDCMDGCHGAPSSKLCFDSKIIPAGGVLYENFFDDSEQGKSSSSMSLSDVNLGASSSNSDLHSCIVESHEDLDFSDDVLKYINHILLEESVDEKKCTPHESEALQATERSLYEAIWGKYPASTSHHLQNTDRLLGFGDHYGSINLSPQTFSQSSSESVGAAGDGSTESSLGSIEQVDVYSGGHTAMGFTEEGKNGISLPCLPSDERFQTKCFESYADSVVLKERDISVEEVTNASRGKKNRHEEVPDILVGRSSKHFAVNNESTLSDDIFDKVLVYREEKEETALRQAMTEATKAAVQNEQPRGPKGGKRGNKKREGKKNEVDMRALLTQCAQAVAAEDTRAVNEYLRQIRQHSSPTGDGMQRVAHYFADGLEARIAGAGTQIYTTLVNMPVSASDLLRAYHLYLATSPYRKMSNFFSNKTILNVAENVDSLHIVDFGTLYGFQWPSFLRSLSLKPSGPPRIRFTAIDFPCPGFRPSQRILETGRRLSSYAEKFNVPFEFNGLAQKWETITLEDLKLKKGEVVVANCIFRLRYLLDETVIVDCPRDVVLKLIRKMNPAVFVFGIVNGGYNTPFFLTRFREALFHYSNLFDLLDTIIPRERHERMLLERVVLGREAMNAIACEGAERIERPETYKQWQVRLGRAGLELLPLKREILQTARSKLKLYHKDFVIDEDGYWLLEGWKGRIVYALSSWRPAS